MKINWKKLITSIALPVAVGGISALITSGSMKEFERLEKPALAPPPVLFPIVWSVLFVLMGISLYLVRVADAAYHTKRAAYIVFGLQLVINFFWSIIFFNMGAYLFAFCWLILLWISIILMIYLFSGISKPAAWLQLPYLIWVTFAGYLNLMIYILNR